MMISYRLKLMEIKSIIQDAGGNGVVTNWSFVIGL